MITLARFTVATALALATVFTLGILYARAADVCTEIEQAQQKLDQCRKDGFSGCGHMSEGPWSEKQLNACDAKRKPTRVAMDCAAYEQQKRDLAQCAPMETNHTALDALAPMICGRAALQSAEVSDEKATLDRYRRPFRDYGVAASVGPIMGHVE
jgi:hypothetical protein